MPSNKHPKAVGVMDKGEAERGVLNLELYYF